MGGGEEEGIEDSKCALSDPSARASSALFDHSARAWSALFYKVTVPFFVPGVNTTDIWQKVNYIINFYFRMASVVDKLKKRKESKTEWSKTGSFLNKPDRGWIFPDEQLAPSAGICYGVRVS